MSKDSCGVPMHEIKAIIPSLDDLTEETVTFIMMYTIPRIDECLSIKNDDVQGNYRVTMVAYDDIGRFEDHSHGFILYLAEVDT